MYQQDKQLFFIHKIPLNKFPLLRKAKRHKHKRKDSTHNTKEPIQVITALSRHMYIHPKETTD